MAELILPDGTVAQEVMSPPVPGVLTDRSGTITTGGTAQQAAAANPARRYLLVANPINASGSIWVNFTTPAVVGSPSIGLNPGDSLCLESGFVTTEAVSVIGATTGQPFTVKEG